MFCNSWTDLRKPDKRQIFYVHLVLYSVLAGLQRNSSLWIDDVRLSVRLYVYPSVRLSTFLLTSAPLHESLFLVMLMNTNLILCLGIALDQISSSGTFLCDPDLDFFCSCSLNNFGQPFAFKFALIHKNDYRHYTLHVYILRSIQISLTETFLCDPDLEFYYWRSFNILG